MMDPNLAKYSWLENFKFFNAPLRLEKLRYTQFSWCYCIAETLSFHLIPITTHNIKFYYTFKIKTQNHFFKVGVNTSQTPTTWSVPQDRMSWDGISWKVYPIKMFISRVLTIRFERLMALKTRQALIFHVLTAQRYRNNFNGIYDVSKIRSIFHFYILWARGGKPPRAFFKMSNGICKIDICVHHVSKSQSKRFKNERGIGV